MGIWEMISFIHKPESRRSYVEESKNFLFGGRYYSALSEDPNTEPRFYCCYSDICCQFFAFYFCGSATDVEKGMSQSSPESDASDIPVQKLVGDIML